MDMGDTIIKAYANVTGEKRNASQKYLTRQIKKIGKSNA